MAKAKTFKFAKAMIMLGNGAASEVFDAPCGFDTLSMTLNFQENTVFIPDCDNPDDIAWGETDLTGIQMRLEGSGLLDTDAMKVWDAWWYGNTGEARNVRWFRDLTLGEGGGYYEAPAQLVAYQENGTRGNRFNVSVGLAVNGKPVFTAAS